MTSKGGSKQQVTLYYMSQHFGICSPVDKLRGITVNEKIAWTGSVSGMTTIPIDQSELFGGPTKQGGVKGNVYFLPGAGDQVMPDNLAQKLGRANGDDCPGYRGLASAFFTGPADGQAGFYWTANDPYLPGVWIKVERAPVGLSPGYAMVPRPGVSTTPVEAITAGTTFVGAQFSPDHRYFYNVSTGLQVFDLTTRTLASYTAFPPGDDVDVNAAYAIAPDAIYALASIGSTIIKVGFDGSYTDLSPSMTPGFAGIYYVGGQLVLLPGSFTGMNFGLFTGSAVINYPTNYWPSFAFNDVDGNGIAIGGNGSAHELYVGPVLEDGDLIDTSAYGTSGDAYGFDNGVHLVVIQGSYRFLVSKTRPYSIISAIGSTSTGGELIANFEAITPGSSVFWMGLSEYRSDDLSLIRTVDFAGWPTSGHSEATGYFYDWYNNGFITGGLFGDPVAVWRLLDRGEADANPAHIIYECLTNTDWGMGSPSTLIDVTAFENAGVELFNEPLGLSMIWTKQDTIQNFIQEVLDHIQATLFVEPQSGLLTLKLIRGDYDVDTLPTISPSTANLSNFGRKLWGDIVNEINVTWTNPDNEQDETVTAHDLASITTQGGVVSDSRNYYGVRYSDLAMRLAARDLRSAAAPLATCDAEVDRSYWALRPASVIKIDWPQYGLDGVVMRVTSIDCGKPGDPTIKLSLIEDVFGLDVADYVAPPSTIWTDPSSNPTAMTEKAALTLPYYLAAQGITPIAGATYPEVLAGVLGASSNSDTFGYELWSQVTLADGTSEWESIASLNLVGYGELGGTILAEASSTGVTFSSLIGVAPARNTIAIIGSGTEADNELALITAAGTTFALSRGVLDTVPKEWASGTPVWFVTADELIEDPTPRSIGEAVDYRLRTRTSKGLLSLYGAPPLDYTLTDRPWLPLRPANVTIGGVQFNDAGMPVDETMRSNPWVTVSWSNRNRLLEDSVILNWADATVTPETGQTTTVTVYGADGTTMISTHTGITGTTYNVPDADLGLGAKVLIVPTSSRSDADGTFESLQGHGVWVKLHAASPATDAASGHATASFTGAAAAGSHMSAGGSVALALVGTGATTTVVHSMTPNNISGGWNNYTARQMVPAADLLDMSGTQMRITMVTEVGSIHLEIDKAFVGPRGTGTWDLASKTQIFWNGGSPSFDLIGTGSAQITSDPFAFTYDGTVDLVFMFYFNASAPTNVVMGPVGGTARVGQKSGGDDTGNLVASGYTLSTGVGNVDELIASIEVA